MVINIRQMSCPSASLLQHTNDGTFCSLKAYKCQACRGMSNVKPARKIYFIYDLLIKIIHFKISFTPSLHQLHFRTRFGSITSVDALELIN